MYVVWLVQANVQEFLRKCHLNSGSTSASQSHDKKENNFCDDLEETRRQTMSLLRGSVHLPAL